MLFILGSGTSVDSGLNTYRGYNSINGSIVTNTDSNEQQWQKHEWLLNKLSENLQPGPTYFMLQELVNLHPGSTILTQNIDGLVRILSNVEIIELHGTVRQSFCDNCENIQSMNERICTNCSSNLRPNIIRIGDDLKVDLSKLKKRYYSHVVIVGTTLQFPYLRTIIGKAKSNGAKAIHINPDEDYDKTYSVPDKYILGSLKYKRTNNVRKGEILIRKNAYEGLIEVYNTY